jgi:acetoin utilization protein AcuB
MEPEKPTIAAIMTRGVLGVQPDTTLGEVVARFAEHGFHHLPVMERGRVVGMLSDRDVLRAVSPYAGTWGATMRDDATLKRRAHQVMTRRLVWAEPDTPVDEAIEQLLLRGVSCLLVMEEGRRLVGIVTWRDLLERVFDLLEEPGPDDQPDGEADERDAA